MYAAILHVVTQDISFFNAFIWTTLAKVVFAGCFFLSAKFRAEHKREFRSIDKYTIFAVTFVFFFAEAGMLFNHWALSLAQSALVFSMEASQAVFVFLFALLLTRYKSNILNEKFDRKNVLLKIIAVVCMVGGVLLLAFG